MRIILGVSGGIAAYKSATLLRLLKEAGHSVRVIPTKASLKFVGAATWEALSGEPVSTSVFDHIPEVAHVELGKTADLVLVAPATADLLSRAATGRADDLLTATLLVATCPVVMAPAMHTQMWQHPATQANVATLRERGVFVIEPDSGRLTGSDSGPGRLPDPEKIAELALGFVQKAGGDSASTPYGSAQNDEKSEPYGSAQNDVTAVAPSAQERVLEHEANEVVITAGENNEKSAPSASALKTLVVTAGGTREPIDPVRWIGNRSTGKQGIAIAEAGAAQGMAVTLIAANIDESELAKLRPDGNVRIVEVETCLEMLQAVREVEPQADAIVMAAAVADYRPLIAAPSKVKKQVGEPTRSIDLIENPDILAGLCEQRRPGQVIVGFAAETGDGSNSVLDYGRAKAQRKGADLLAVNDVSAGKGFGAADNKVWLLDAQGELVGEADGTKRQVAEAIIKAISARL